MRKELLEFRWLRLLDWCTALLKFQHEVLPFVSQRTEREMVLHKYLVVSIVKQLWYARTKTRICE